MHWVLVVNGENTFSPSTRNLLAAADRVVAVDGGSRHLLEAGMLPHIVLGDMDSIPKELLATYQQHNIPLYLHPPQKDATDLELALELAIASGATAITLLGATGGRLDHTLGNLFLLTVGLKHKIQICIKNATQDIYMIATSLCLQGSVGDTLSLIPLSPEVEGITLQGLQYPLNKERISFGSTRGISNIFVAETVSVTIECGYLLVVHLHSA